MELLEDYFTGVPWASGHVLKCPKAESAKRTCRIAEIAATSRGPSRQSYLSRYNVDRIQPRSWRPSLSHRIREAGHEERGP